jgi:rhodanese-related sulfurtransferase
MFELFLQENIALFGLLLVLVLVLAYDMTIGDKNGPKKVTSLELPLLQRQEIILLDISPEKAFANGHIEGSINIPAKKFNVENKAFKPKDKDQTIVVIDQNGMGASVVTAKLINAGYKSIRVLDGGIATWKTDNYPLVKS